MGRIICNKSLRLCSKPQMKRSFWKFMLFQWFLGFVYLKSGGFLISCRFFHKPVRWEGLRQSVSLFSLHIRQYRTKSVWRLCTPSACKFPVIFHKNAREYIQYSLRFLFHLTKNLMTHLSHNLCAVLPKPSWIVLEFISFAQNNVFLLRMSCAMI